VSGFRFEALGALVRRHRADDTTGRAIRKILRADVIIIDDIGLHPVAAETAEAIYRVVDAAYERRAIALSSNLHPSGFDELMPKTIANATVDRLMHHAHVVLTAGDSIRLTKPPRKGGQALGRMNTGQNSWPSQGSSVGHDRAVLLAITGQNALTVDNRMTGSPSDPARFTAGEVNALTCILSVRPQGFEP
jgi:hypothetical protein